MPNCVPCNNNEFILTHDWSVVENEQDLYSKNVDCRLCNETQKIECKKQLISIITQKPIDDKIDYSLLLKKYNNGENLQDWNDKARVRSNKKHR